MPGGAIGFRRPAGEGARICSAALFPPRQIDNDYLGFKLAIWLLVPPLLFKSAISVNALGWNPLMTNREVLQRADRIPLDAFSTNAADTVVCCSRSGASPISC